jgi:hypothetical protein
MPRTEARAVYRYLIVAGDTNGETLTWWHDTPEIHDTMAIAVRFIARMKVEHSSSVKLYHVTRQLLTSTEAPPVDDELARVRVFNQRTVPLLPANQTTPRIVGGSR